MTSEDNGNFGFIKPTLSSNEDLSEYTDAESSVSAPTEFLAEFLSAVMLKDYVTALKYCKLILQYEPNNATAKEFYPLILEKLRLTRAEEEDQEEEEGSSSEDDEAGSEENSSSSSSSESESSSTSSDDSSEGQEQEQDDLGSKMAGANRRASGLEGAKRSKGSSDGTTGSYSSLEDEEAETTDQLAALAAKYQIDNVDLGNGNKIFQSSNKNFGKRTPSVASVGKQMPLGISSDSESPTEPTQQTIAMLRARVVPTMKS